MKRDDTVYLRHMLDAIDRIQIYITGMTIDDFLKEFIVQDAVVRQIGIIGEAARNVSKDFQNAHPELPWVKVIGIRNKIIHAYFEVNYVVVWDTVQDDLPTLKRQVERLLEEHSDKSEI